MDEAALLAEQYADAANLSTRGDFNDRFTLKERHPHEWVYGELSAPSAATVLDLGCGPGSFWTGNDGRIPGGWRAVLGDRSEGMVIEARDRLADASVTASPLVMDAERLPFDAGTFDAVLALQMLYHVPNRARALAECRRVVRPDGTLYATTGSEANARPLFELMSAAADGPVSSLPGAFTAENGREQLLGQFDRVERRLFENEVVVDDPDAVVAYALSLPLDAPELSAFEPDDADRLRERVAARIARDGAVRWRKDMALFVAHP